jgi:hypothetical protein
MPKKQLSNLRSPALSQNQKGLSITEKPAFFLNWSYGVFGTKSECRPAILHKSCLKL